MRRLVLILCLLAGPVLAVQPDEILDDPALEARARDLSTGLRCLVCRNENIDESNADLARDLRILVRERLVAGDSNDEVIDYLTDRFGEYVLLKPTFSGANLVLWITAPVLLLLGGGIAAVAMRRRARAPEAEELTEDEKKRLEDILGS